MSILKVSPALTPRSSVNGYSMAGLELKAAFHRQGKTFLKALAGELGLSIGSFDVRSNLGGTAGSGEVTLHCDELYVQLFEGCTEQGIRMMYRSCDSRKDYCGHTNNFCTMVDFKDSDTQARVLAHMRRLILIEQDRKVMQAARRGLAVA